MNNRNNTIFSDMLFLLLDGISVSDWWAGLQVAEEGDEEGDREIDEETVKEGKQDKVLAAGSGDDG